MSFSTKSIGIGLILGLIFGVVMGYSIQLNSLTPNPFEDQIDQLESQINTLESQQASQTAQITALQEEIDDLESLVPLLPPSDGEPGSSRFFPAEMGDAVTCTFEYRRSGIDLHPMNYTASVAVTEIIRGVAAWALILEENQFNDPPINGSEYIMVKINFTYISGPTIDTIFEITNRQFSLISADGYEHEYWFVVRPEPDIGESLYPGASHEGWGIFQVHINDDAPMLTFGREDTGEGGIWIKVYE
jgi:hypothetical protein